MVSLYDFCEQKKMIKKFQKEIFEIIFKNNSTFWFISCIQIIFALRGKIHLSLSFILFYFILFYFILFYFIFCPPQMFQVSNASQRFEK